MQRVLLAGLVALLPTLAMAEGARGLESFGDWVVGCDDTLACTAIGMSQDMAESQAYLRLTRAPAADAAPVVSLSLSWWDRPEGEQQPDFKLSLVGDGTLTTDRLMSEDSGSTLHADLVGTDPAAFLRALLPATALRLDADGNEFGASISLAGMSAALRWMDAAQGRDDGETALVATGPAPATAVPPPPVTVTPVRAVPMTELDPVPPAPTGAPERDEFCNEYATNVAYGLPEGRMVYGVCAFNGAYNIGYNYVLVSADGATVEPVNFPGPDAAPDTVDPTLVNAGLSEDGKSLAAFSKGRGLSDCGDYGEWVFDGSAFRITSYALMPECRGVPPEDWPVIVSVPVE